MRKRFFTAGRDLWLSRVCDLAARVEAEFDTYRVLFEDRVGDGAVVDNYSDGYMRSMRAICNAAKTIADVLIALPDMSADARLMSQCEFLEIAASGVRCRVVEIVEETLAYPFNDPRRSGLLGRMRDAGDEPQDSAVFERLRRGSEVSEADREVLFGILTRVREGCVSKRLNTILPGADSTNEFMRGFRSYEYDSDQGGGTAVKTADSSAPLPKTHGGFARAGRVAVRGMNAS